MAERGRGERGKLTQLVELIDEHLDAFAYDWRARFGLSIFDTLAGRVPWGESLALFRELLRDPSSHVTAAVRKWRYPMSREAHALADLYDLTLAANWNGKGRRPKPYPRPTDKPPAKLGNAGGRTPAQVFAILAARGHEPPRRRTTPHARPSTAAP